MAGKYRFLTISIEMFICFEDYGPWIYDAERDEMFIAILLCGGSWKGVEYFSPVKFDETENILAAK